jgi:predicted Zn-dependent peptidase
MNKILLKDVNETIYHEKLDNGLNVFMYPSGKVEKFEIDIVTKYGGRINKFKKKNEKEYYQTPNGVAHFLEHITFHLPNGVKAEELFNKISAYTNAYTNHDHTVYYVTSAENFKECLETLLYTVYTPCYTDEVVEHERDIIKAEEKRYENDPDRRFYEAFTNALFHKCNQKYKVVGTLDDISAISLEDINKVYSTFYHPANMSLYIAGNFDKDEAIDIIKKKMDTFKFDEFVGIDIDVPEEPYEVKEAYKDIKDNVMTSKVAYNIKYSMDAVKKTGLSLIEYDLYLELLLTLNFGATSEFYEKLLDDKVSTSGVGRNNYKVDNNYIVSIHGQPTDGRIDDFIKMVDDQFNNLSFNEKDVIRKRKTFMSSYITSFDKPIGVLNEMMENYLYYDKIVDNWIELSKKFTPEIAKKIIDSIDINNKSIVIMEPDNK